MLAPNRPQAASITTVTFKHKPEKLCAVLWNKKYTPRWDKSLFGLLTKESLAMISMYLRKDTSKGMKQ